MNINFITKLLAIIFMLDFLSCSPTPQSPEELLVEESAEYMKALYKATAPDNINKYLLPEVDKIKDENKARWAAELKKNCNAVEISLQKEGNSCRIKALAEGVKQNPKFDSLKDYARKKCEKVMEPVSDNCNQALEKILNSLLEPVKSK